MALALAQPQQRGFWIAADRRLHQCRECLQQSRLCLDLRLASTTGAANARRVLRLRATEFHQPAVDRATGHTRRFGHRGDAPARRTRLARDKKSPGPLVLAPLQIRSYTKRLMN
jgi:hypothetical protein